MPPIAMAVTAACGIVIKIRNYLVQEWQRFRNKPLSMPVEIDSLYGLLFASFYYLYLQVVKNAMEPLTCHSVGGKSVMHANPSIECVMTNPLYVQLRFWAITCLVVYGMGIPLLFLVVLVYYRKEIRLDQVWCSGGYLSASTLHAIDVLRAEPP
jgi:hypothetical protein